MNPISQVLKRKAALLFPGQGAQHVGMGADIYGAFSAAKHIIDECDDAVGGGLKKLMFEGPQDQFGFNVKNFTYALGHSLGEYSALVATNSLSLSDAIQLVRLRGLAMHSSLAGSKQTAMRALVINGNDLEEIENLMAKIDRSLPEGEVAEIANVNSRSQVVLSGTAKGVEYAGSIIQTKGYSGRSVALPVSAPFHCSLMRPAAEQMGPALKATKFRSPLIDVISNVTATPFSSPDDIGDLLTKQITATVQWQRSIQYAREDGVQEWVVVGPSKVLSNLLKKEHPLDIVKSVSSAAEVAIVGNSMK